MGVCTVSHCLVTWYARGSCLYPCVITPRGFTSLPTQEVKYSFSGFVPTNKQTNKQNKPIGGGEVKSVGSFSRTKREGFSGTKFCLVWICSVIFEFSATFRLFGTYLHFGDDILILAPKSQNHVFGGRGGGVGGSGDLWEVSASVSGKNIPLTPCLWTRGGHFILY